MCRPHTASSEVVIDGVDPDTLQVVVQTPNTADAMSKEEASSSSSHDDRRTKTVARSPTRVELRHGHGHTDDHAHGHDDHHHHKAPLSAHILSGLTCGLIFYVFSALFSAMIFDEAGANIPEYQTIGIGMNVMSASIGGFLFSTFSSCHVAMAGPDITPVVFIVEVAKAISYSICPDGTGTTECDHSSREKVFPTVMLGIWFSTIFTGLLFFLLGKARLTYILGYIPAQVTGSFASCIGYKVMYYAIQLACGTSIKWFKEDGKYLERLFGSWEPSYYHKYTGTWRGGWMLLLCALVVGIPLYIVKRRHLGKQTINFPAMIIIPTAIFYIALFSGGGSMESARKYGWLFPESDRTNFWSHWELGYGGFDMIAWDALPSALPVLLVMFPINCLDILLQFASSEIALEMDLEHNKEIKIGGTATILSGLLFGTPTYSQTKLNVLNHAFTHSKSSSIAGYVMASFCTVVFFAGVPLLNYLPRPFLAGLLMFYGAGYLVENLWDARLKFNRYGFLTIWTVFIANIVAGELTAQYSLLIALVIGVILAAFGFAFNFARRADLSMPISGEEHCSTAVRSAAQEMKLGVLGRWYHIFPAKGYLFFGCATRLYRIFKEHCNAMERLPACERTKMIIFDLTQVTGMDATSEAVFQKIRRLSAERNIALVWAGLSIKVEGKLTQNDVIKGSQCFKTLDAAEKHVEDTLLNYVHNLSQRWLVDKTCLHIYNRAMLHDALTAHVVSDGSIGPSQLFKWAVKRPVEKGELVFEEGDLDDGLYLLYLGKVDLISVSPPSERTVYPGAFFNEQVLYNSHSGAMYSAIAKEDSVMLRLDGHMRQEMQWHEPHTAYSLLLAMFRQAELQNPQARHPTHAKPEMLKYADASAASSPRDAVQTRGIVGARKMSMYGDATKVNMSYKNMIKQIDNRIQLRRADSSLLLERRKSDLSSTTPLIGEESSSSPKRQTLTEKLLHRHHDGRGKEDMRHESILDKEFISGSDFHVPMTPSQVEHYKLIFQLIDHNYDGDLTTSELSMYMYSLGHGVPAQELENMLHEVGIDEDQDGSINEDDFLEFIRRCLVANLPSSRIPYVNELFQQYHNLENTANSDSGLDEGSEHSLKAPALPESRVKLLRNSFPNSTVDCAPCITRSNTHRLMRDLGFDLDEHTFDELFEEVDSRGDGTVTRDELITALGMLKQNILEVNELEKAFTRLREGRQNFATPAMKRRSTLSTILARRISSRDISGRRTSKTSDTLSTNAPQPLDDHMVYASDLVTTLGVTQEEAEEMIFIADLVDNQAIDFTEFKQIVVNWS